MRYLLALGSNLGDRSHSLEVARQKLAAHGVVTVTAGEVVETEPWDGDAALPYLNQVLEVETELRPLALLELAKRLEVAAGRDLQGARNGPRPLDIDLLACRGTTMSSARLTLPHPRLAGRGFLRQPLQSLAAAAAFFPFGPPLP
jgi:2-amino-4-hydroxy-6-hydroxymethyldihydropteridine diphosphokinase